LYAMCCFKDSLFTMETNCPRVVDKLTGVHGAALEVYAVSQICG
jgi:hypothetical protein